MFPAALSQSFTADGLLFAGRGLLRGWSIVGTDDTDPFDAVIYDAAVSGDTAKPVAFPHSLATAGDTKGLFVPGVAVERGLFVNVTGAGTIVVWYNTETSVADEVSVFNDGTADLTTLGLYRLLAKLGAV